MMGVWATDMLHSTLLSPFVYHISLPILPPFCFPLPLFVIIRGIAVAWRRSDCIFFLEVFLWIQ